MTIDNEKEYLENVWDWAMFNGCFGDTRIEPTDVDGMVERNGMFLWIEAKCPNVPLKDGQRIATDAAVKTGYFTVLVMWGERNKPEKALLKTMVDKHVIEREYASANEEKCREIVSRWFKWADSRKGFVP